MYQFTDKQIMDALFDERKVRRVSWAKDQFLALGTFGEIICYLHHGEQDYEIDFKFSPSDFIINDWEICD